MDDRIRKLLELAVRAPSGDNAQPWRFEISGDTVSLYNIPERDRSLYNFRQHASYIAHGALIENIEICSGAFGLLPSVTLLPANENSDLTATIRFSETRPEKNRLHDAVPKRTTNRKSYARKPISDEDKQALLMGLPDSSSISITIVDGQGPIERLARELSVNERIVLENRDMHRFLFQHIRWSAAQEQKLTPGMNADTLELAGLQRAVFRLARHWPLLRLMNVLGLSKKVASENARAYAASGAFIAFRGSGESDQIFLNLGRVLERVWLTATSLGLWAQPLTGIPLLSHRLRAGEPGNLSVAHTKLIQDGYAKVRDIVGGDGHVLFFLRIGRGQAPSASTSRQKPTIIEK